MDRDGLNRITMLGVGVWIGAWLIQRGNLHFFAEVELLLFFGVAVTIPLALALVAQPDRAQRVSPLFRWAVRLYPVAMLSAGGAVLAAPGGWAVLFAGVWLLQTLVLAAYGLTRLLPRPVLAIEEICVDAGLIYLPISGVWLIAHGAGYSLLGFDPAYVLLTAVHFSFIGPGALVIAGMIGRHLHGKRVWRFYRVTAWLAVVSPALVATGILVTRLSGVILLESASVLVLATSFLMIAYLYGAFALPENLLSRFFMLIATLSLTLTMAFALAFTTGNLTGWWGLSLARMVDWHGWVNAVGFVLFGLLSWRLAVPDAQITSPGIPFSRLPWRWRIGPDFLERINAVERGVADPPTGIVDRMTDYERRDFNPAELSPTLTAFYEYTAAHELRVYPEWQPGFGFLSAIYKRISQRVGQMNFPARPETDETRISSAILPLKDALDGREQVRGWVRVYAETGQAVYVAAYASHCLGEQRFMNIAFPLPGGNLTSILRLESLDGDSLLLTSFSSRDGDQGVYFANRLVPVRLPINETIRVFETTYPGFPPDFAQGDLHAEHKMWLLGRHFLTLHYSISAEQPV